MAQDIFKPVQQARWSAVSVRFPLSGCAALSEKLDLKADSPVTGIAQLQQDR